jgi:hypothetical protein
LGLGGILGPHYPFQGPGDEPERTVGGKFHVLGTSRDKRRVYREMVQEMDRGIGEIVATPERLGIAERTFVSGYSGRKHRPSRVGGVVSEDSL